MFVLQHFILQDFKKTLERWREKKNRYSVSHFQLLETKQQQQENLKEI